MAVQAVTLFQSGLTPVASFGSLGVSQSEQARRVLTDLMSMIAL